MNMYLCLTEGEKVARGLHAYGIMMQLYMSSSITRRFMHMGYRYSDALAGVARKRKVCALALITVCLGVSWLSLCVGVSLCAYSGSRAFGPEP